MNAKSTDDFLLFSLRFSTLTNFILASPIPPSCSNGRWTEFFKVDNATETSDSDVYRVYPNRACSNPSAIDVRLLDGRDYKTAGQVLTVTLNEFSCHNDRQWDNRRCLDYKVRYCCPRKFFEFIKSQNKSVNLGVSF